MRGMNREKQWKKFLPIMKRRERISYQCSKAYRGKSDIHLTLPFSTPSAYASIFMRAIIADIWIVRF
ncbi:MAG: hypothetical protein DRN17_01635 [Thermoplasmata archaeon]|nr:MAG: hypothetical protein DRN17_01635 [Thermoplasmata archaeon]